MSLLQLLESISFSLKEGITTAGQIHPIYASDLLGNLLFKAPSTGGKTRGGL